MIVTMALNGCARPSQFIGLSLPISGALLRRIDLVILDVALYRVPVRGGAQLVSDWSDTARGNLTRAIVEHFGRAGEVVFKELDTSTSEAREESERTKSVLAGIPLDRISPDASGGQVECVPGPLPAIAGASTADALLLLYATDRRLTAGYRALLGTMVVFTLPIMGLMFLAGGPLTVLGVVAGGPRNEPNKKRPLADVSGVALCLVDRATGAVLWFNFTPVGTRNLTDAGDADDLIRQSYSDFHRAARMHNESATPRPGHD